MGEHARLAHLRDLGQRADRQALEPRSARPARARPRGSRRASAGPWAGRGKDGASRPARCGRMVVRGGWAVTQARAASKKNDRAILQPFCRLVCIRWYRVAAAPARGCRPIAPFVGNRRPFTLSSSPSSQPAGPSTRARCSSGARNVCASCRKRCGVTVGAMRKPGGPSARDTPARTSDRYAAG